MASTKGVANLRSSSSAAKQSFLPPKSPFPIVSPSYGDYGSIGSKGNPTHKPREGNNRYHHQRTSSESFLIEEQPSWLDDLLNEPDTPVRKGAHRRSSSDSFAYLEGAAHSLPPWAASAQEYYPQNKVWEPQISSVNYRPSGGPAMKEKVVHHGSSCVSRNADVAPSNNASEKNVHEESAQDSKVSNERKEVSHAKHLQSEVDPKRAKQQFAQRSRVRKLQYIAELERNVQALQAEGLEVSAEIEFLSQQNLILDLENKALKQRLESLAQEQLIKRFQHEMFEREIARLRSLYQQQQQHLQPQPAPTHNRSSSRDLDAQFANLSLKHQDPNTGRDPVSDPLRI
ncbi:Uncharacterized protein ACMD2_05948 [Ananas comosus]|uniref:BZIP domain-containing protein n=1 Tax=Ananas comosus TaxID=4615 RepID=A0A199UGT6_ANACO|nr:Uncharacterized protein ACMD2_05948 [Ananas comosus]